MKAQLKLDQETWLCRTHLGDFLVKIWTILDHIRSYYTNMDQFRQMWTQLDPF